jgi:hypothetical protein
VGADVPGLAALACYWSPDACALFLRVVVLWPARFVCAR